MAPRDALAELLARLGVEVGRMARQSRSVEACLATAPQPPGGWDLQELDSLTQHLEAAAVVLSSLSYAVGEEAAVDQAWIAHLVAELSLEGLAGRLSGAGAALAAATGGEAELW